MALLIGTRDGVFRSPDGALATTEQVLDAGDTLRVRTLDGVAFAATRSGLYRSADGLSWTNLDVPHEEVFSVVTSPDGERLYAGTHPAHLYVSTDDGETWRELDGFQDLPSRPEWHTPRHRDEAHVRSLGTHPDAPDRVVAGIEVGGVHVSDDEGETWVERRAGVRASEASAGSSRVARDRRSREPCERRSREQTKRSDGVHDDVHHVLVLGADEYVASCGGGLYRTRDAGRSWTRLDGDLDHRYFREAFAADGQLYTAAARGPPGTWQGSRGADAALFESMDGGESFETVPYPGAPEEFVLAWAAHDGRVFAGTDDGRLLARESDGWTTLGHVPAAVRSLTALDE
ncbi:glycosyl hydrolase [Halococcus sp. AFM35]|uniref:WD40/YVTN/BNR-like repeat-containing protein n=1 Tax=Halococcus sp. AFM35 TaxID=3421653 RepID=UPI003EB96B62